MQLGQAIRRYRLEAKLTQGKLAERAGLRQATISLVENGSAATRADTICALLAALDIELVAQPRTKGFSKDFEDIF
jgi:HTH-type transcriptional regulator/antitoxin HipB